MGSPKSWTAAAALMLASCGGADTGVRESERQAGGEKVQDMTPEGPSIAAKLFGGGKPMPLDVQQQAANGMILYVTSIQAKPTETVLGVKVVNGADRDVMLDWSDQKTFLAAGGQKFFVSPPVENKNLKVVGGATMEGDLVFLGRLPRSGTVTLVINEGQSDSQYNNTPGLSVPLPTTDAAFSDDGSKKNLAA